MPPQLACPPRPPPSTVDDKPLAAAVNRGNQAYTAPYDRACENPQARLTSLLQIMRHDLEVVRQEYRASREEVITEIQTIKEETLAIKHEIGEVQAKTEKIRKEAEKVGRENKETGKEMAARSL
jgi:hypothetical protein